MLRCFPKALVLGAASLLLFNTTHAQSLGDDIINTVSTAVPFLRIPPDARSGGMGDVGIGVSPDANSMFFNTAKMSFNDKPLGIIVS
jgi:hypothetical protein